MTDLFLGILIPIFIGFFIFSSIEKRLNFLLSLIFSIPLGFGLTSILYYCWLLTSSNFIFYRATEVVVLFLTGLIYFYNCKKPVYKEQKLDLDKKYIYLFFFMNILALVLFIYYFTQNPIGSWDGWRIWNTKAEFLFKGGEYWKNVFLLPSPLAHADYPLFLPATIARIWKYLNNDWAYIPVFIAFIFTFSLPILIFEFFKTLKNPNTGLICASSLLGTQLFIINGAGQLADVPLSFFILTSICLVVLSYELKSDKLMILAGLLCGMSCWVKNEGFLFIFALLTSLLTVIVMPDLIRYRKVFKADKVKYFLAALLPVILFTLLFKFNIPVQNDIIEGMGSTDTLSKIFDFSRYFKVLTYFINFLTGNVSFYVLGVIFLFAGVKIPENRKYPIIISILSLLIMLLGYLFIYVLTPNNIDWQLRTSFDRVFLQIWSSILVIAYMCNNFLPEQKTD